MNLGAPDAFERRVLVLAPTGKDGTLTTSVLGAAGIPCLVCPDLTRLVSAIDEGAGVVLLAEEAIADGGVERLADVLRNQPPWSDLPILLLSLHRTDSPVVSRAVATLGNVTLLERPTSVTALVSAVRAALRARQKQYQIRAHLAEREQAAEALRESARHKDEFLATLAHELRNPLAPIRNAIYVIRRKVTDDATVAQAGEMMERQFDHMVRLVDDLMEIARINQGKIEMRRESVDLGDVVRDAVEIARPSIEAARHQLMISLQPEPLTLDGDRVRLAQVFANLLNNAAKYTSEGGEIRFIAQREGDRVSVAVRDTGMGIPSDMLTRVFDMFAQVDVEAGRTRGGLGIGLALVRSIVGLHGGSVEARSEGAGKGSEFVVDLPLAAGPAADARARREAPPVGLAHPCSVLIVDDNQDAADSLGMLLSFQGIDVRVVHDGPAALLAIEASKPSAVLLDIGMPGMDGVEVARRIRGERRFDDVTLIALSGWGREDDRRRFRDAGFDHHLIKPATLEDLRRVLGGIQGQQP